MPHRENGWIEVGSGGVGIAYQEWLPENYDELSKVPVEKRILAYPGWLDNSGSWEPLAPFLAQAGYAVVAIDPPGCGKSSHRSKAAWYHDFEECELIMYIADRLEWTEPFILLAHSRGSNIAITTAGGFPHRVRAAVLVESGLGMAGTYLFNRKELGNKRPDVFKVALQMHKKNANRPTKVFASWEDAVKHNSSNPTFPKSRQIAESIVKRHTVQLDDGLRHTFIHDTRTYGQVQSRFISSEANLHFLANVRCPVINILGSKATLVESMSEKPIDQAVRGLLRKSTFGKNASPALKKATEKHILDLRARMATIPDLTTLTLEGYHHLHGDIPEKVAPVILSWLDQALVRTKVCHPHEPLPIDYRAQFGELFARESVQHLLAPYTADPSDVEVIQHDAQSTSSSSLSSEFVGGENGSVPVKFELEGLVINGQQWGDPHKASRRVLAICDARDNSGSFDELASLLTKEDTCIIALDPLGLAMSCTNVPSDFGFSITELAALVLDVADDLGWDTFSLYGHGMGASTCLVTAGGVPERVQSLVLFDVTATTLPDEWNPSEMTFCFEERRAHPPEFPSFPTLQDLISRLETDPRFPKSHATASAIAKRKAIKGEQGTWTYRDDPRTLRIRKPGLEIPLLRFRDLIKEITCPVLAFLPLQSARRQVLSMRKRLMEELALMTAPVTVVHPDGWSHVHSCHARDLAPAVLLWQNQVETIRSLSDAASLSGEDNVVSKL